MGLLRYVGFHHSAACQWKSPLHVWEAMVLYNYCCCHLIINQWKGHLLVWSDFRVLAIDLLIFSLHDMHIMEMIARRGIIEKLNLSMTCFPFSRWIKFSVPTSCIPNSTSFVMTGISSYSNIWWIWKEVVSGNSRCSETIHLVVWGVFLNFSVLADLILIC